MWWKLFVIAFVQSAFLAVAQLFLKLCLERVTTDFKLSWSYLKEYVSWQIGASAVTFFIAMLLWFYMLKNFNLSMVYPLTSISYIFTILLAMFFLGESIPLIRWVGVILIMVGVALLAR